MSTFVQTIDPTTIIQAVKDYWGLIALVVLVIAYLAFGFFRGAALWARIVVFLAVLIVATGFGIYFLPAKSQEHDPQLTKDLDALFYAAGTGFKDLRGEPTTNVTNIEPPLQGTVTTHVGKLVFRDANRAIVERSTFQNPANEPNIYEYTILFQSVSKAKATDLKEQTTTYLSGYLLEHHNGDDGSEMYDWKKGRDDLSYPEFQLDLEPVLGNKFSGTFSATIESQDDLWK